MEDTNQIVIPDSFMALYLAPGRSRPGSAREVITRRYEFCEDLAAHLSDMARAQQLDLGIAEDEVLRRCRLGLDAPSAGLEAPEAAWVIRRLAELAGWPDPGPETAA